MSKWEGLNRRKFPRVNYPCLVVLNQHKGSGDVILTHTENIGIGGICIILKQKLDIFSPVEIELDLLDLGDHIRCKGKVVWNVQRQADMNKKPLFYDIGVEFDNLTDSERKRLLEVVDRLVKLRKIAP